MARCGFVMSLSSVASALLLTFSLLPVLLGTGWSQSDPVAGILPFPTRIIGPIDSVDLATSEVLLDLPVRNKLGKIPFTYALIANLSPLCSALPGSGDTVEISGRSNSIGLTKTINSIREMDEPCGSYTNHLRDYYSFVDNTGAVHPFPPSDYVIGGPGTSCWAGGFAATTTDGTGYTLSIRTGSGPNPWTLYDRSGNHIDNLADSALVADPDGTSVNGSATGEHCHHYRYLGTNGYGSNRWWRRSVAHLCVHRVSSTGVRVRRTIRWFALL